MNISLSVIIPTYNRSSSLAVTLEGLRSQSYSPELYEVVIVSDGSTDNTRNVVDTYRSTVKNSVQFIEQQNAGPSVARNKGLSAAMNAVVVFLDDDVEPAPEFLERHAVHHSGGEPWAVVGPMLPDPALEGKETPWIAWEHHKLQRVYRMFQPGGPFPDGMCGPTHFYSGNASVSRSMLVQLGGFDPKFNRQEDVELAFRLEKAFGVRFTFDFKASGIHRPARSFESWLKIPNDYGRLDAKRIADGSATMADVRSNFDNRHWLSKWVMSLAQRGGTPASVAVSVLTRLTRLSTHFKARKITAYFLSGLYNAVYGQVFHDELRKLKANIGGNRNDRRISNSTGVTHL